MVVGAYLAFPFSYSIFSSDYQKFANSLETGAHKLKWLQGWSGMSIGLYDQRYGLKIINIGYANSSEKKAITSRTLFQVGSLSKPFASLCLYDLLKSRNYNLNEKFNHHCSQWHLEGVDGDNIRIVDLLNHTAGLPQVRYPGYENSSPTLLASLNGENSEKIKAVSLTQVPASFSYSGAGYTALQFLLEQIADESFAAYAEKNVLKPLNMSQSSFQEKSGNEIAVPQGYFYSQLPLYKYSEQAAAGLYVSPEDMGNFFLKLSEILQDRGSKFFDFFSKFNMYADKKSEEYFLGFQLDADPENEQFLIGHKGANRGWRSIFLYDIRKPKGIFIFSNSDRALPSLNTIASMWQTWNYHSDHLLLALIHPFLFFSLALYNASLFFGSGLLFAEKTRASILKIMKKHSSILATIGMLLLAMFWMVFYSPYVISGGWIIASFLPAGFFAFSLSLSLWPVWLLVNNFYSKMGKKSP